ncbi:MAG: type VI secretion system contractile sheath large subunit [Aquabacterium sp.]|uniref:type VI secretion system contractile sheath domain-containing protein n=1 Tax=Aquabacterium sp. TaxID=1872578 RepID=UPI00272756CF|nr:type VI secretion system contractile sheath large subunit [Aquabacterium sp.]MDO9002367.1 type VI secretion system contractile sheath large subunit [Aquabacterium sp.]
MDFGLHDGPFRIVVLGDFSGHGLRGQAHPQHLAQRVPQRVDIDNFEAVFKRMGPALSLPWPGAVNDRLDLTFGAVDDFHPDQLAARLPTVSVAAPVAASPSAAPASASRENDASTLERLLGRKPEPSASTGLDALIQRIVAPSLVPEVPAGHAQSVAAQQAAQADLWRAVLHHPAFQSLEAAWLGVQQLVRSLDLDGDLQLYLLDASQAELQADVEAANGDEGKTSLAHALQRLADVDEVDEPAVALVVGLHAFGPSVADLGLLAALGALARQVGGTFMAAAQPAVVGLASLANGPDPAHWPGMAPDEQARWDAFRRTPEAAGVHLAWPRILLRLPYGQATDPISAGPFEEMAPAFAHEQALWGNGALACAQLIGQSFMDRGWDMRVGDLRDVEDLPAYVLERDGEKHLLPCAEANLSETVGDRLLALGLMPLLSYKHRNAVRVMSFQAMG